MKALMAVVVWALVLVNIWVDTYILFTMVYYRDWYVLPLIITMVVVGIVSTMAIGTYVDQRWPS